MLQKIKHKAKIIIKNIPAQWLSKIELYYPELPNFPLLYIHKNIDGQRMYGFPVAVVSVSTRTNNMLSVTFQVLSNVNLSKNIKLRKIFRKELRERIGISDKISRDDINHICEKKPKYINFFRTLWDSVESTYGKYIPYGKFYEEMYSIVRFVAAFQPKTGRQSEMRMLYNFMTIFGERIEVSEETGWGFCDFYLLPTYSDLKDKDFNDFPKFKNLFSAMEKVYQISFVSNIELKTDASVNIKCQTNTFPTNTETFSKNYLERWVSEGSITTEDRFYIERLVDAFNRFPWRAAYFISSIFIAFQKPYETWETEFFIDFYNNARNGISPKVIACFLQQSFKKTDAIPIDIWVESFYKHALNIQNNKDFFNAFYNIGKLERIIWLASQANKTNIRQFLNMLWCCRYGTKGNTHLRGANPLACYECKLRTDCIGFESIQNAIIYVTNQTNLDFSVLDEEVLFVCITNNSIPKKIYKRTHNSFKLIDEFSGYLLANNSTPYNDQNVTVNTFLESIQPPYNTEIFNVLENISD